ncbi:hypothetical protein AVEN_73345-1 [Araneus ventricosus]|uniref:Uncharacterized protein n=1 Tax=Araneus ventricosus TaxID=182803 RepID=A0A4Y2NP13_ARAVE|nr:hypothetical protein AVEN_73345-1 [Araneus ventricosus]
MYLHRLPRGSKYRDEIDFLQAAFVYSDEGLWRTFHIVVAYVTAQLSRISWTSKRFLDAINIFPGKCSSSCPLVERHQFPEIVLKQRLIEIIQEDLSSYVPEATLSSYD